MCGKFMPAGIDALPFHRDSTISGRLTASASARRRVFDLNIGLFILNVNMWKFSINVPRVSMS